MKPTTCVQINLTAPSLSTTGAVKWTRVKESIPTFTRAIPNKQLFITHVPARCTFPSVRELPEEGINLQGLYAREFMESMENPQYDSDIEAILKRAREFSIHED